MRLIDADTVVTIQVYDDRTGETDTKKMTIAEAIDEWSDEGCPPAVLELVKCDAKGCKFNEKGWCKKPNKLMDEVEEEDGTT